MIQGARAFAGCVVALALVVQGCSDDLATTAPLGAGDAAGVATSDVPGVQTGCKPGAVLGCASIYAKKVCDAAGEKFVELRCEGQQICVTNGECVSASCVPGTLACLSPTMVGECGAVEGGFGYHHKETPCDPGLSCVDGACLSSCGSGHKATTNVGCEYALVDLGNYESDPDNSPVDRPMLVVVSNTSGTVPAHVEIRDADGTALPFTAEESEVAPGGLRTFRMPTARSQLKTSLNRWSWRLTSDQPITVHQFNPENGPEVRSNDATLLFPVDALGSQYVIMGWKSFWTGAQGFDADGYPKYGFPSYVTVVATEAGTTQVSVRPTADIRAGGSADKPVAKLAKGETRVYTLKQGDVLNLATEPLVGEVDLTGTLVQGDRSIAVFMAHNCAFVPAADVKFCDHLEHQLAPVTTWGDTYVADTFKPRSVGAFDVFRVMAKDANTTITTDPPLPGANGVTLGAGEWVEYQTDKSHLIAASKPVQVGHYMIGSNYPGFLAICGNALTGIGDPAFTIGVATNQYLDEYVVLTPPGYSDDWLNVVRRAGDAVLVDGADVDDGSAFPGAILRPVGASEYEVVHVPVGDGVHTAESLATFGITAYGYHCDVSYAYPGGMLLKPPTAGGAP